MPVNISGVSLFSGAPLIADHLTATTGRVFYVGSTAVPGGVVGVDAAGAFGDSPQRPFATIDYAIGQCAANRGDIIYVLPGHNEGITASITLDVAGVQILGLGHGNTRPVIDFDGTAATIEMDAANTRLSNVVLRASVTAGVVAINVDADRVEIDHIETDFEATGDDFITTVDVDAFDYAHIHDNVFTGELTAGADEAIRLDDSNFTVIEHNRFTGQWANAPIFNEGALCSALTVRHNIIYNADTSVYNGIDFTTMSSTGIVAHNDVTALYATTLTKLIRTGDMTWYDNRFANAVSERGALTVPTTTSA